MLPFHCKGTGCTAELGVANLAISLFMFLVVAPQAWLPGFGATLNFAHARAWLILGGGFSSRPWTPPPSRSSRVSDLTGHRPNADCPRPLPGAGAEPRGRLL
jgi:hypothetical protein